MNHDDYKQMQVEKRLEDCSSRIISAVKEIMKDYPEFRFIAPMQPVADGEVCLGVGVLHIATLYLNKLESYTPKGLKLTSNAQMKLIKSIVATNPKVYK